ncbi:Cna protein B-type domain-containing protein, partial [Lachnospiraceae bacterium NK3A20]
MKGKKKGRLAAAILASVMTLTLLFQAALPASAEGVEDLSTAVATESDLPENTVEGGTESTSQEMSSEDVENEAVGTSEDETATTSEEDAEIQPSSEGSSEENASETQEDSTVLSDDGDNSSETEEQESDVANAEDSEEEMTISEEAVVEGTQEEEISDTDEEGEEYNSEPITGSESSGGVTVYVNAPEGSFPEGTTLSIEPINQSEAETLVSDTDVTAAVAFDITFYDANGDRVQPQNGKTVEVTFSINGSSDLAVSDGEEGELQVIHVGDEGNEQLGSTVAPENGSGTEIRVDADSFSPYAVVLKAQRRAPAATPREVPATITNFTIQNLSGQDVEKVYFTDKFYLAMDWDASSSGADLHEGDYFDITLPSEMRFPSDSASVDFNIYGDDGTTVIATAHVSPGANNTGGTVRVTFTNWVEGKENIKGNIHLAATFDRQQIQNDQDNTFSITVNGQVTPVAVHVTGPQGLKPEVIGKWGQTASSGAKDEAEWYVRINHQKATLTNVVISDHLSAGAGNETYIPGSFILARVEMDAYGDIKQTYESDNSADLSGRLTISTDRKSFSINLGDLNGDQYRLRYSTTYTPGTRLRNNVTLTSTQQTKTTSASHISADSGGSGTGNLANKIKLTKVDADNNSTVLAGAVFEVTRPDGSTFELTTGADGTVTSGSLTSGTYRVKEKVAPVGYELNEEEFELQVTPDGGAVKTITDKKLQINISITKKWEDADNQDGIRPSAEDFASKVKLMNGTEEVTGYPPTVTDNGDGTYTVKYSDLPEYVNGSKADYKIAEDSIDGYTADKTSAADGETITNSHTPGTTEISITKKWADTNNQDGIRPSANEYAAKVHLMNGDTEVENVVPTVTDNGDGTYTVTYSNLPKNSNGTAINYTVKEDTVDGYEADQSTVSNGQTMTNTHTPETTSVSGTKTWEDNNDQDGARPESITIRLLANGEEVQSKEVTAEDNWSWTFSELPKYKDGAEIAYSVKEDAVTDYSASYEGANVTNTHTPGKTSVSVTKAWDDSNNQDGKRPNSVTVHLYADDVDTGKTVTLSEANNWSDSFTDLDEKKNGQKINYTVKEDAVAGYTSVTSGDAATGYTVTNSYTPETTNIHGAKTWDDNNNQDGARPESITIRL